MTKNNCDQYQRVIVAAFLKKIYDDIQPSVNVITYIAPDKLALRAFNCLAYNWEIIGPLIASYFPRLPDYYTLSDNVKFIHLVIFWKRFLEFALHIYKP